MKHNASKTRKTWTRILLVAAFVLTLTVTVGRQPFSPAKQAEAKTVPAEEYNLYFHVKAGKTKRIYVTGEDIKKVKSSNKAVMTAKLNKKKTAIVVHTKKKGTAKVIITYKDGSKDNTLKYDVEHALTKEKESEIKSKFNKSEAKQAFKIQNSYRAEVGVDDLEWSDELYDFAKYRLKTSGFDYHENMTRDAQDYFGDFYMAGGLSPNTLSENLAKLAFSAQDVCKAWKNSSAHYKNLLKEKWQCGAIAYDEAHHYWVAVFSRAPVSTFADWQGQMENYATVTVKRYDSASGEYLNHAGFCVYEKGNKSETMRVNSTGQGYLLPVEGEFPLALEIGKTYVFTDRAYMDGYNKADSITLTVTGDCEVVLIG